MKPASVVFLIFSVVLIIGGLVICSVASGRAANEGVALFDTAIDEYGNSVREYALNDELIEKIAVDLDNVRVRVIGGSDRSYCKLVNLKQGDYMVVEETKALTVKRSSDLAESTDVWNLVTGFHGLRQFLPGRAGSGEPEICIYLSDRAAPTSLQINVVDGNVEVSRIASETDISVTVGSGNVSLHEITGAGTVQVISETGNASVTDMDASRCNVSVKTGEIALSNVTGECVIRMEKGPVALELPGADTTAYNISAKTSYGTVTVDGETQTGTYYVFAQEEVASYTVISVAGDIAITTSGEAQPAVTESGAETTAPAA